MPGTTTTRPRFIKWRIYLAVILVVFTLAAVYGWYQFTKRPPDTRRMSADYTLEATELVKYFKEDEPGAAKRYVDKVLAVTGVVKSVERDSSQATVTIEANDPLSFVTCSFYDDEIRSLEAVRAGTIIRVKGNCTGILTDVVLNKCSLVE